MALPPVVAGVLGSLAAGLATGVGALPIFARRQWGRSGQVHLLALAAGVMLGAAIFSLILPAMEIVQGRGGTELGAAAVAGTGVALGALAIWGLHTVIPHEHFIKGVDSRPTLHLGRNWLFVLAITLHNFPEGMSVGVAWGAASTALPVTVGIALQNLPEGLAVAGALVGDGFARRRAFAIALATGLVEPVGGLAGALAVTLGEQLLPWALAFAGGAMLFVISGEVIPETHREGHERRATFSLVAGFVIMMLLDVVLG